ncbi:excalibur calcium-binding domain-containing protein [Devosia sp. CAU 1758]
MIARQALAGLCALALVFSGALAQEQSQADPSIYKIEVAQVSCQPRRTCSQIGSCEEARWYLNNCSWGGRLDGDSDGAPCEQLCGSNN